MQRPDCGGRGQKAEFLRAAPPLRAKRLPTAIIGAAITIAEFRRRLHRNVNCLKRDIGKEWLGRTVHVRIHVLDHAIDDEFARIEVIRQMRALAILEPICRLIIRKVCALFPIVGA